MKKVLILLISFYLTFLNGHEIVCGRANFIRNDSFPEKTLLSPNYTAVTRITNFINNHTSKVVEKNYTNVATWLLKDNYGETKWILGDKSDFVVSNITLKNPKCIKLEGREEINAYNLTQTIKSHFNITIDSISEILDKIHSHTYDETGNLGNIREINGVETLTWFGCKKINETNNIQITVTFSGDRTEQKPYDPNYSNPIAYEISIIEYKDNITNNKTEHTIISDTLLTIVELEKSNEIIKHNDILPPRQMFCENFPKTSLPSNIPKDFEGLYKIYNNIDNEILTVNIFHSKKFNLSSYKFNGIPNFNIPFIGKVERKEMYRNIQIVQDFVRGYEFLISKDSETCLNVKGLSSDLSNVGTKDSLIYQKDSKDFMISNFGNDFYFYGSIKESENMTFDSYVKKNDEGGTTEVLFLTNDWKIDGYYLPILHTINYNSPSLIYKIELASFKNTTNDQFSSKNYDISSCLPISDDSHFVLTLKNTTVKEVQKLGLKNVYDSLSNTLSNKSEAISNLRFTNFYIKQTNKDVMVFFSIGNKLNILPSKTIFFKNQTSLENFKNNLNNSVTLNDISFLVGTETLYIRQNSFKKTPEFGPDPDDHKFVGYTSASMFVLGFFAFTFGILLGVAGVVFHWKRHRLTNLSYQIFE